MNRHVRIFLIVAAFMFFKAHSQVTRLSQLQIIGKPEKSTTEIVGVKDASGRFCAAIQVVSDMEGFSYQSYNGVVRMDDQPGKDMVYVSPDERVLEILHSGFEPLKAILSEYGIQLHEKDVWVLKVSGDTKMQQIPIAIVTTPGGADITLDGKSYGSVEKLSIGPGTHEFKIVKQGYEPVIKTEIVDENNTLFKYALKTIEQVPVEIKSEPPGASVTIDGLKFGTTPFSNFYPSGKYPIRIEKDWYVPYEDYIDIKTPATRQNYTLRPDFGKLIVTSSPETGLDISINDEAKGVKTPHTFEQLRPGNYRVKAKSSFFETTEKTVEIQREADVSVQLITEATYATLTIQTLPGAKVYLNGQPVTELSNIRLEPQVAVIRAEMPPKAKPVEKRVALKRQDNQTVEVIPEIPRGTIQVAVQPFDTKITLKGDAGEVFTANQSQVFKDIPAGQYNLEAVQAGYKTYKKVLVLKEGDVLKEIANLEPGSDVPEGFVFVKGGTFQMGDMFGEGDSDEKPVHTVTVSDFYLSKYEVTVAQYRAFCNAKGRSMPQAPSWGWQEDHPIVNVNWKDAVAFCKHYGYRLPTEAEWEYAAREGGRQVRFGNGKDIADPSEINFDGSAQYKQTYSITGVYRAQTTPAGSFQPNSLGLYDMSGNAWEWCQDWYGENYYSSSPSMNPQGPGSGSNRVLRGGSWCYVPWIDRCSDRDGDNPDNWAINYGFRPAR